MTDTFAEAGSVHWPTRAEARHALRDTDHTEHPDLAALTADGKCLLMLSAASVVAQG